MSLVRPILVYGAACWDPYREGQITVLDRVQKKAAKFAHHTNSSKWETLASRRKLSRICALFKAYSGERSGRLYVVWQKSNETDFLLTMNFILLQIKLVDSCR